MSWDSVDSSKATEKQIKYAEVLLEAYYGDICFPINTMSKKEISELIDDVKKKCSEKNIDYHNSTIEQATGHEVGDRLMPYVETAIQGGIPLYAENTEFTALEILQRRLNEISGRNIRRYQLDMIPMIARNPFYGTGEIETLAR